MDVYARADVTRRYQRRIDRLTAENAEQKKQAQAQEGEIERLRSALRALTQDVGATKDGGFRKENEKEGSTCGGESEEDDDGSNEGDGDSHKDDLGQGYEEKQKNNNELEDDSVTMSDSDDGPEDPPLAILDDDGIPRCTSCLWEVIDGLCQHCSKKHAVDDGSDAEDENILRSMSTDYHVIQPARRLSERGLTPLLDIPEAHLVPSQTPAAYTGRREEYLALIGRGATRLMCETFSLEFTQAKGIIAWADEDLFREFSGPAVKQGDQWKIYLGREITLDSSDPDGSVFIEELLEEAVLFPPHSGEALRPDFMYKTFLERPGVWATIPVEARDKGLDEDGSGSEDVRMGNNFRDQNDQYDDALDRALEGIEPEPMPVQNVYEFTEEEEEGEGEKGGMKEEGDHDVEMDEEEEDGLVDEDDPAVFTHPARPDREFDIEEEGVYDSDWERPSSVDSDFDEDEELSGDEWVLSGQGRIILRS